MSGPERTAMARWLATLLLSGNAVLTGCVPAPVYRNAPVPTAPQSDPTPPSAAASSPTAAPGGQPQHARKLPTVVTPETPAHPVDPASISTARAYQVGVASFYGEGFQGRKTANGETFNMYKLTAAHRVLPLGTLVKVTNLENGRWVVVKINDRGPFVQGRILDVSFAAALELEMAKQGSAKVMIELVASEE